MGGEQSKPRKNREDEGRTKNPLLEKKKLPNFVNVVKHSKFGDTEEVEEILEKYDSDRKELLKQTDTANGYTALHWACRNMDADLIRVLIEKGANPKSFGETGGKFDDYKNEAENEDREHLGRTTPLRLLDEGITDLKKARKKHKEGSPKYEEMSETIDEFETLMYKLNPVTLTQLRKRELGKRGGSRTRRKRKQSA